MSSSVLTSLNCFEGEHRLGGKKDILWMKMAAIEFIISDISFIWDQDTTEEGKKEEEKAAAWEDTYWGWGDLTIRKGGEAHYGIRYYTCTRAEVSICGCADMELGVVLF